MKKTIALIAAIAVAALSICTLSICAFADGETTTAEVTTEAVETTTEAAETTTAIDLGHPGQTDATTTEKADDATDASDADADKTTVAAGDEIKTNAPGQTAIDDPDDATTKAPAAVDDDIPSTGSKAVVPAIALLALAGSVAVAVKAKKD